MMTRSGPFAVPCDLSWGIRPSFLRYLESLEDLEVTMNDGVTRNEGADFVFPYVDRVESPGGEQRLEFWGDLRLSAHGGMLLVILMNPWLTLTPDGAELSVVDLMAWPDTSRREVLGRPGGPVAERKDGRWEAPLLLAPTGVETFNSVYPEGAPLAPARLYPHR